MCVMIKANIVQFCGPVEIIVGDWLLNLSAHPGTPLSLIHAVDVPGIAKLHVL